jgi:hypothetical protein
MVYPEVFVANLVLDRVVIQLPFAQVFEGQLNKLI